MCGIAGFLLGGNSPGYDVPTVVRRMADSLTHRGPDAGGVWTEPGTGVALGHRRLAILDLSVEGLQPMHSSCERYVVTFNGEIYNHAELRGELERDGACISWRGHSDTETMLAAIAHWGLEAAVRRFVGMFAFALWDRRERALYLVRDRLGEKPVYYGWLKNVFVFGSEMKALRMHPAWRGEINRYALMQYLRLGYVPAPHSIYQGIYKLTPGTIIRITERDVGMHPGACAPVPYWSLSRVAEDGLAEPFPGDAEEAAEHLEGLLGDAVRRQMVADVPLGAFLSGGVDSSAVVALMQARSNRPVRTFTIGFNEPRYNEAEFAKAVARHVGTEHTELYVTPREAMAVIPGLPALFDEPFSDSSQIPTFLVSRLARRHVTVSLSGDGGDELFGGYNHYFRHRRIWHAVGWMPYWLRRATSSALRLPPTGAANRFFHTLNPVLPMKLRQHGFGDMLCKLSEMVKARTRDELYDGLVSLWKDPSALVLSNPGQDPALDGRSNSYKFPDFSQYMMFRDTAVYLPDDILVKLDRSSMGVGLETRVPMLDHRVVEFSWRIPISMKIRGGQGKRLLRRVLYKHVPQMLIERQKMGFSMPVDDWLRGPLRDWAEGLLDERRLRQEGFFHPMPIRERWQEHLSGHHNWQHSLWNILMFQSWLDEQSRAVG